MSTVVKKQRQEIQIFWLGWFCFFRWLVGRFLGFFVCVVFFRGVFNFCGLFKDSFIFVLLS